MNHEAEEEVEVVFHGMIKARGNFYNVELSFYLDTLPLDCLIHVSPSKCRYREDTETRHWISPMMIHP